MKLFEKFVVSKSSGKKGKRPSRFSYLCRASIVSVLIFCAGCAGSSAYMRSAQTLLHPTADKALVRFMRPSGYGFAINFNILDGEEVIGNCVAKSQFDYLTEPGKHLFIATAENKAFLEADLEAGKTYYVLTRVYMGAWRARVSLVAVNRDSEFWNKVEEYETALKRTEPDKAALKKWENANKPKIKELVRGYEAKWKSTHQWPTLRPGDGR